MRLSIPHAQDRPRTGPRPQHTGIWPECSAKADKTWSSGEGRGGRQRSKLVCEFFYPLHKCIVTECPPHSESSKCVSKTEPEGMGLGGGRGHCWEHRSPQRRWPLSGGLNESE